MTFGTTEDTPLTLKVVFIRYMNEEGWAPAVYLKRLGFAPANTSMSLRRWSGRSMSLREDTNHLDGGQNKGSMGAGSTRKYDDQYWVACIMFS